MLAAPPSEFRRAPLACLSNVFIGVGIDALIEGERVIYAASRPKTTVSIAPTSRRSGRGVLLSVNLSR